MRQKNDLHWSSFSIRIGTLPLGFTKSWELFAEGGAPRSDRDGEMRLTALTPASLIDELGDDVSSISFFDGDPHVAQGTKAYPAAQGA